jgi:hypothetical protein
MMPTPRHLATVAIALLLAGVAIIGWMIRRGPSEHAGLGLTLLVNRGTRAEVTPATPLFFEVSITSARSSDAFPLGSRWRPWHRLVRLEASGAEMPWTLTVAGSPRSLSVVGSADARPEIVVEIEPSPVAHLEAGRQVYTVTHVASPEAMAAVRPGAYRVRAVIETPSWMLWGWRGRQVSQPVTVVVRDAKAAGTRDALEKQRLQRTADYYLGTERFAEAEKAARQLLAHEPDQAHAHVLLGDALVALKRRDEALAAYRRAMMLIPPSYEKPTMLMDQIQTAIESPRR